MGQVTIYLDTETERQLNLIIKEKRVSKSKWISDLIRAKTATEWPDSIIQMAGAWDDLPMGETIRDVMGKDIQRESF
ncbi:MAG: ribbon-helix-helix domain-containing protein [Proteobacteria bacterium]|nr:ribbon-helix-helix domain-containing protein [Pseudomonadota bacterium]